ncbi:5723_t:CDS:2 [Ambispora leptoticha]|uniref:5723_t:CDS:1 n=1 Tax=Ambispora leptoticha TaxID=144679 RepID=A0A9N9AGW3_9GLOM|nr:5723_t:CDS:2 [Ambispora leptoticha]
MQDIRVIVAIDFGTTYSGFAYSHIANNGSFDGISLQRRWPGRKKNSIIVKYKADTLLQYDKDLNLIHWGCGVVAEKGNAKGKAAQEKETVVAKLFKLHLANINNPPSLPDGLDFRQAITEYLMKLREAIIFLFLKIFCWPGLKFPEQFRIVLSVPAEYGPIERNVMRLCAYNASLIEREGSANLEFTTESEAAALWCMKHADQYDLREGDSYLVADCGGGTTDLAIFSITNKDKLDEMTERSGAPYGGSYVDQKFVKEFEKHVGKDVIRRLHQKYFSRYLFLMEHFCHHIKFGFTGIEEEFEDIDIDIDVVCPAIKKFVEKDKLAKLEEDEWIITFNFDDIKRMFTPSINRIIELIDNQIYKSSKKLTIKYIFLVGGFSESPYLQKVVKDHFEIVDNQKVVVPSEPLTAVLRGAAYYGLNMGALKMRVLKRTYGLRLTRKWDELTDPKTYLNEDGTIYEFDKLVTRGEKIPVDHQVTREYVVPISKYKRSGITFRVYMSKLEDPKYIFEEEVIPLGNVSIVIPDEDLVNDRRVEFSLTFGSFEIKATAKKQNKKYEAFFTLDTCDLSHT